MKRIMYLDLCRGFTVLFIPIIHCVMLYSKIEVHHSWLGLPLALIAEWPGGQLFMLMMGMWIATSRKPFHFHVKKAIILLACGYLLNLLKYVIPAALEILPQNFIEQNGFSNDRLLLEQYTIGDILHFSSIAIIVTAAIKELPGKLIAALLLNVVVLVFASLFQDLHSETFIIQHLLDLIGGHPNRSFFPVFPWLVFVLTGFVLGMVKEESTRWMITMFFIGVVLFAIGYYVTDTPNAYGFYRPGTGDTMQHLGFLLMWIPVWKWITPLVSHFECLSGTLIFCSKNITSIYFIQWVVVAWLFPFIGYRTLGVWQSFTIGIIVTVIVLTGSYLLVTFFTSSRSIVRNRSR